MHAHFLTLGLILTAVVNLLLGFIPALTSSIFIIFIHDVS
ncbi:glycerol-3-phosphate transporter [Staphylococcus gallinarum]|uniref:Glycerol-3-phosphate transporter n=1 Tax=Staphylococcus gallinarum TaxID=1293 RepID=A0A380FC97_STAGA|nr:glycerol-3-phosphate transporter [Staphylococcus gallinarum]